MAKLTKEVSSPEEYKEVIEAAEILGLEVKATFFYGAWDNKNNEPVFPSGNKEIKEVGYKYFTVELDGVSYQIQSAKGYASGDSKIVVEFK